MMDSSEMGKPPAYRLAFQAPVAVAYLIAALVFISDAVSKYFVHEFTPYGWNQPVTGFFNLVHVLNPGAAFSFLADAGGWQRYLFVGLGTAVSAFLAFALWRGVRSRIETAAYIGLMGGALGNVIDRLRIGAVMDYLDFYWQEWHWPAFNLADIFVVGGAALLVLASVMERAKQRPIQLVEIERRQNISEKNKGAES